MNYQKEKERHISYCGSYCKQCDWFTGRNRQVFQAASDALELFGFKKLLKDKVDIKNLKLGLKLLANSSICPGCKAEIVQNPAKDRCQIRQCAHAKGLDLCVECSNFPCKLLKTNPGVIRFGWIENLKQIKTKGLKYWVDRQWQEHIRRKI